jgi:hypothetical protein
MVRCNPVLELELSRRICGVLSCPPSQTKRDGVMAALGREYAVMGVGRFLQAFPAVLRNAPAFLTGHSAYR